MPYKTEKLKLPPDLDARRKLTIEQVKDIKSRKYPIAYYKKKYSHIVSVSMIKKYYYDMKRKEDKDRWKKYYTKEKQAAYIRKHRARKYELLKDNTEMP